MEHDENVADGALTLKIDAALAQRLRVRAQAAGQSVEEYALGILRRAVEEPGFGESETQWHGASVRAPHDNGFGVRDAAYWQELEAICDEADRTGGIPWEQVEARLLNFGQKR
jgi:plasmid stability protein